MKNDLLFVQVRAIARLQKFRIILCLMTMEISVESSKTSLMQKLEIW